MGKMVTTASVEPPLVSLCDQKPKKENSNNTSCIATNTLEKEKLKSPQHSTDEQSIESNNSESDKDSCKSKKKKKKSKTSDEEKEAARKMLKLLKMMDASMGLAKNDGDAPKPAGGIYDID